jgi:hypothetical protein
VFRIFQIQRQYIGRDLLPLNWSIFCENNLG